MKTFFLVLVLTLPGREPLVYRMPVESVEACAAMVAPIIASAEAEIAKGGILAAACLIESPPQIAH